MRLRILELPAPRDADGRFTPGAPPFVFVIDRITTAEAPMVEALNVDTHSMETMGARGGLVFPPGLSVDIPSVDDDLDDCFHSSAPGTTFTVGGEGWPDVTPGGVSTFYPGRAGG